jgi:hypothetical protein
MLDRASGGGVSKRQRKRANMGRECVERTSVSCRESVLPTQIREQPRENETRGAHPENLDADFQTVPVFARDVLLRVKV